MKTETVVFKKKKKNKKHQSEHIKGEFLSQIGLFQKEWSGWLLLNQTSTSFSSWKTGGCAHCWHRKDAVNKYQWKTMLTAVLVYKEGGK